MFEILMVYALDKMTRAQDYLLHVFIGLRCKCTNESLITQILDSWQIAYRNVQ